MAFIITIKKKLASFFFFLVSAPLSLPITTSHPRLSSATTIFFFSFLFFAIKRYGTLNPYVTPIMSGHTVHVHYPLHQSDNCIRGREKLKTSFQLSLEITYSALIKNHQPRKLDNNTGLINLQKYTKKCEYMSSKV